MSSRRQEPPIRSRVSAEQRTRALPHYVPPSAPLDETAIATLDDLCRQSSNIQRLKKLQANAVNHLHDAAYGIYERTHTLSGHHQKGQAKLNDLEKSLEAMSKHDEDGGLDDDGGNDATERRRERTALQDQVYHKRIEVKQRKDNAEKMKRHADEIYEQAELRMRQTIDAKTRIQEYEDVLAEVSGKVQRGEGRVAPTQSTLGASQFHEQPDLLSTGGGEGHARSEHELSVLRPLQSKLQQRETLYSAQTMHARYAEQADYAAFKSTVHDALHQDDGVSLPHSNTWFPGENENDSGLPSTLSGAHTQDDDADSDIEIARERISTRCPITLVHMEDPITSPCNHNFESFAVLEMLRRSSELVGTQTQQRGRRTVAVGGEKVIRCPVTSCEQRFTESMLRRDPVMRRKIERIRRQERERENGGGDYDEDEDVSRFDRAISISTDVGPRRETPASKIKKEMRSSVVPRASVAPSVPREESAINDEDDMDEDYDDDSA